MTNINNKDIKSLKVLLVGAKEKEILQGFYDLTSIFARKVFSSALFSYKIKIFSLRKIACAVSSFVKQQSGKALY